jgi:hypothetical protein
MKLSSRNHDMLPKGFAEAGRGKWQIVQSPTDGPMKRRSMLLGAGIALAMGWCGASVAQPTTYQYVGTYYASPSGTFTTSMRITGSFTTANPLPPNMAMSQIGPAGDGRAVAWTFGDGVSTFTEATSAELYGNAGYFSVATDALGNVSNYSIGLVSPPPPHSVGTTMQFVWIDAADMIQALNNATCAGINGNVCNNLPFIGDGAVSENSESGRFLPNFASGQVAAKPVPVDPLWSLALLAMLVGGMAARRLAWPGARRR